jgi:hypothetical protein
MRELPVEHARDSIARDHQVAHPEVAVHEGASCRLPVRAEDAKRELEDGMGLAQTLVEGPQLREGVLDRRCKRGVHRHPVHGRKRPGDALDELRRSALPRSRDDLRRIGRSGECLHQRPGRTKHRIFAAVLDDARHRDARPGSGLKQGRLSGRLARLLAAMFALQDELPARGARAEPGFPRGASAELAELARDRLAQHLGEARAYGRGALVRAARRRRPCRLAPLHRRNSASRATLVLARPRTTRFSRAAIERWIDRRGATMSGMVGVQRCRGGCRSA